MRANSFQFRAWLGSKQYKINEMLEKKREINDKKTKQGEKNKVAPTGAQPLWSRNS